MLINKDDLPVVALGIMNDVHYEDVDLINELDYLIQAHRAGDDVGQTLAQKLDHLLQQIQDHFAQEEEMMRAISFPPYPVHKQEHDRVLAELQDLYDTWKATADSSLLEQYIQNTLPQWMFDHISTMDMVTAAFIANQQ